MKWLSEFWLSYNSYRGFFFVSLLTLLLNVSNILSHLVYKFCIMICDGYNICGWWSLLSLYPSNISLQAFYKFDLLCWYTFNPLVKLKEWIFNCLRFFLLLRMNLAAVQVWYILVCFWFSVNKSMWIYWIQFLSILIFISKIG